MTAYATVEQLKVRSNYDGTLSADRETAYEEILDAISRKVDGFCGRPASWFVALETADTRYFEGEGNKVQMIPECIEITSVAVKDSRTSTTFTAWDSPTTDYAADGDWYPAAGSPDHPIFSRLPYTLLFVDPNGSYVNFTKGYRVPTVEVTAKWGYAATAPADIREAVLIQSLILLKRLEGSGSSTLATADLGAISLRIRQNSLARDVKELLVDGRWVRTAYDGYP